MTDVVWRESTGHVVLPPYGPSQQGQLFPVVNGPYEFYCPLTGRTITHLTMPPAGEFWHPHPWWRRLGTAWNIYILSYELPDSYYYASPFGPPREDCPDNPYCVHDDGCADCNPDVFVRCPYADLHMGAHANADPHVVMRIARDDLSYGRDCTCEESCDSCSGWFPPGALDYLSAVVGVSVCNSCRDAYYSYCDECEIWCADEDGHSCPSSSRYIHEYSYAPNLIFRGDGPLYFGMELEIGGMGDRADVAEYVSDMLGDVAYLKEDSSIDDGFEVVTHPMSFRWAMENIPWRMFERLRSRFYLHNDESCGLHVHISRAGFTNPAHAYRWQKFIYRNKRAVTRLARRSNPEWCEFGESQRAWQISHAHSGVPGSEKTTNEWWWDRKRRTWGIPSGDRYQAINTRPPETFEVRVFAGTVYRSQVQAALAFCHATVEYTRTLTTAQILKASGWQWEPFVTWCRENNPDGHYDSLLSEIERLV